MGFDGHERRRVQGGPADPPSFGFNALPGGFAVDKGQSGTLEDEALFWTANGMTTDQRQQQSAYPV